jgi:aspartate/methionine/tyrosine aminotransferase
LISRVARTHASLVNPASGPAQAALCALPTISDDYLRTARKLVSHRMRELCSVLESIGLPVSRPEGGFYLWLNVADLVDNADMTDAVAWCEEIGRRYGVGLWPGQDFGDSACVRLAYTAPSDSDWLDSVVSLKEALTVR